MSRGRRRPNRVRLEVSKGGVLALALAPRVRRRAREFLKALRLEGCELSVALVKDREIRALNRTWRQKDHATDVLSFPLGETPGPGLLQLGDVVISVETARRQAAEYGHPLGHEVERYLAHGVLHLLGYDHLRPKERARMAAAEEKLLGRGGMLGPGV